MSVDWNKAPEWATHAIVKLHNPDLGSVHWSYLVDGEHRVSPDGLWFHPDGYRVVEERPRKFTTTKWSGEGLPPVGTVCLCTYLDADQEVRILGIDGKDVWCHGPNGKYTMMNAQPDSFRPIRTPEQIAAEKREKTAEYLHSRINPHSKWHKCPIEIKDRYRALVDEGYGTKVDL